jgi:hypothetical protein
VCVVDRVAGLGRPATRFLSRAETQSGDSAFFYKARDAYNRASFGEIIMRAFSLTALAVCLSASSAIAAPFPSSSTTGPRVAAGSSIDPYQEFSDKGKCHLGTDCLITFSPITNSGIFIQHVACGFEIKTDGVPSLMELTVSGNSVFNVLSANKTAASINGAVVYTINMQADLFVDVSKQPEINVFSTKAVKGLSCTITGIHVS